MANHYDREYTLGYREAIDGGESIANPHIYQTVDWYAWDCGFRSGQRMLNRDIDNNYLELEAALAAWSDEISRY
jgi:hypothetical protein